MKEIYYKQIKNILIDNEINKKVKDYSKNKKELQSYYNVGKILSDAGKHYGESIIKQYSTKLTNELGKGYSVTNLKYMRQFYLFGKSHSLSDQLSWTHYRCLLSLNINDAINYYIKQIKEKDLSVRNLRKIIKERLTIKSQ